MMRRKWLIVFFLSIAFGAVWNPVGSARTVDADGKRVTKREKVKTENGGTKNWHKVALILIALCVCMYALCVNYYSLQQKLFKDVESTSKTKGDLGKRVEYLQEEVGIVQCSAV